jgi:hypothetical protein
MKMRLDSREWKTDRHGKPQLDELEQDLTKAVDKSIAGLTERLKTVIADQKKQTLAA